MNGCRGRGHDLRNSGQVERLMRKLACSAATAASSSAHQFAAWAGAVDKI